MASRLQEPNPATAPSIEKKNYKKTNPTDEFQSTWWKALDNEATAETLRSKVKQLMTEMFKLKTQSFPVCSESPYDCALSDVSHHLLHPPS